MIINEKSMFHTLRNFLSNPNHCSRLLQGAIFGGEVADINTLYDIHDVDANTVFTTSPTSPGLRPYVFCAKTPDPKQPIRIIRFSETDVERTPHVEPEGLHWPLHAVATAAFELWEHLGNPPRRRIMIPTDEPIFNTNRRPHLDFHAIDCIRSDDVIGRSLEMSDKEFNLHCSIYVAVAFSMITELTQAIYHPTEAVSYVGVLDNVRRLYGIIHAAMQGITHTVNHNAHLWGDGGVPKVFVELQTEIYMRMISLPEFEPKVG